jgi:hypothetical protein
MVVISDDYGVSGASSTTNPAEYQWDVGVQFDGFVDCPLGDRLRRRHLADLADHGLAPAVKCCGPNRLAAT